MDQTTNSLDLQADRKASRGAAVRALQADREASTVSCKQSPNEGEFLNYQSFELRTAGSKFFSTHSGGWDSKSPRIVNCPSLEHGDGGSDHEFSCEPALSHGSGSGVSEG